jgi:hypothetical protein
MTPEEKKEIDYVLKTATKVVIFMGLLILVLFTIANCIKQ